MGITFINSFLIAIRGIFYGISGERNIKIQLAIGLGVLIVSLVLNISKIYFIIILLLSFLVIILELVNTCFEKLIDEITLKYNKEFGKIKDIMAGVVLLSVILSIAIGILILLNPLMDIIREASTQDYFIWIVTVFFILIVFVLVIFVIINKKR